MKRTPRDSGMSHCPFASDDRRFRGSERKISNAILFNLSKNVYAIILPGSRINVCIIIMIYLHISSENLVQKHTLTSSWSFDNSCTRFMSRHYFTDYLFSRFIIPSCASHIKSSGWVVSSSSSSSLPLLSSSSLSVLSPWKAQRDWLALVPASRFYAVT